MSSFLMVQHAAEINSLIQLISTGTSEEQITATTMLLDLGAQRVAHSMPRGTPERAAQNRLPDPDRIQTLLTSINTTNGELKCGIISALGYWGGEESVEVLRECLMSDDQLTVGTCLIALGKIGGPKALQALQDFGEGCKTDASLHRFWATSALKGLKKGGTPDFSEGLVERTAPFDFD